jgi:hypothetical protein
MVAIVDKSIVGVEAFMTDLATAKTDCKKATAIVQKHLPEMKQLDADTKATQKDLDPPGQKWLMEHAGERLVLAFGKAQPTMEACKADEAFKAAMGELPL